MTGIGIGIVFVILVILVGVLTLFSAAAKSSGKPQTAKVQTTSAGSATASTAKTSAGSNAGDEAAVATALYLYFRNVHDEESGIITINHTPGTAWHAVLNTRF